jgi:hypothetical protein
MAEVDGKRSEMEPYKPVAIQRIFG